MNENDYTVIIAGQPLAQPRPRCTCRNNIPVIYHAGKKVAEWRRKAKAAFLASNIETISGPVSLAFSFGIKRPKSHFGTGVNSETLKNGAPSWCWFADIDNLIKPIMDEMTQSEIIRDDRQIVEISACKLWVNQSPYCIVSINKIET